MNDDDYDDYRDYEVDNPPDWVHDAKDSDYNDALKRWAMNRYPNEGDVVTVTATTDFDYGYSEYTPGNGWEIEVVAKFVNNSTRYHCFSGEDAGDFISTLAAS